MYNGSARSARGPVGSDRAGPLWAATGYVPHGPDHLRARAAPSAHGLVHRSFYRPTDHSGRIWPGHEPVRPVSKQIPDQFDKIKYDDENLTRQT
jgi:hypothetical protein